jgi:tetratricopeptide (TPR) repeat protein
MKIAVYSIAKNEQQNVLPFIESCDGADLILVGVDPGDTTGDLLREHGAKTVEIQLQTFRFDSYRNAVLRELPGDIDVCVSLDLDERLERSWRRKIKRAWTPGTTRLHYWLQWSDDRKFFYDRIHARSGYEWRHANHEGVYAVEPAKEVIAQCDLVVRHLRDQKKDRTKNLDLLIKAVEEDPNDARMRWYLARELHYLDRHQDSDKHFLHYLNLGKWPEERCWAWIFLARNAHRRMDPIHLVIAYLHSAIRECPELRDPYLELAQLYYVDQEYQRALKELEAAIALHGKRGAFIESNDAYSDRIHTVLGDVLLELKEPERAKKAYDKALRISNGS